jgi:hypothetical protein
MQGAVGERMAGLASPSARRLLNKRMEKALGQ